MLCRSGSMPVGLDGSVGFLLFFEKLLIVIVVQRSFAFLFPLPVVMFIILLFEMFFEELSTRVARALDLFLLVQVNFL